MLLEYLKCTYAGIELTETEEFPVSTHLCLVLYHETYRSFFYLYLTFLIGWPTYRWCILLFISVVKEFIVAVEWESLSVISSLWRPLLILGVSEFIFTLYFFVGHERCDLMIFSAFSWLRSPKLEDRLIWQSQERRGERVELKLVVHGIFGSSLFWLGVTGLLGHLIIGHIRSLGLVDTGLRHLTMTLSVFFSFVPVIFLIRTKYSHLVDFSTIILQAGVVCNWIENKGRVSRELWLRRFWVVPTLGFHRLVLHVITGHVTVVIDGDQVSLVGVLDDSLGSMQKMGAKPHQVL